MKAVSGYIKASLEELTKVVWPTKNQAVKLTVLVLTFCVIIALILGVVDLGFNELFTYILKLTR